MNALRNYLDKIKPNFEEGGKFHAFRSVFDGFETFLFVPNTTSKTGTHIHDAIDSKRIMSFVVIALIPALLVSFYMFGLGAVVVTLTSVIACLFFEWAITKFILKRERTTIMDGSAALTGVLLAFNLPSNLPLWIIIIGALVAIGIGKMTFGGLGCNPFNPACGTYFPADFFPRTDDFLAGSRSVD